MIAVFDIIIYYWMILDVMGIHGMIMYCMILHGISWLYNVIYEIYEHV